MAVTELSSSNITWPREGWSSWLNEPIVPADHAITQINLIERVTVSRPGEDDKETTYHERRHSSSSDDRHKRRQRHRRSSSERHTTGRIREFDPSPERRKSRRYHEERISTSHTDGSYDGERQNSRYRSSSGDRNKPLPPIPPHGDRHTTGRISTHRQTSSEEWKTRSLSAGERRKHDDEVKSSMKATTNSVGTSMHGQIFLQDGTPAPDFDSSRLSGAFDVNSNGIIRSGQDTLPCEYHVCIR